MTNTPPLDSNRPAGSSSQVPPNYGLVPNPATLGDTSTYTSLARSSSSFASESNHRSCVTCRRRKVRCDKRRPCANCTKAKIDCVYPAPGRAVRKSKKTPDSELLARLKRLEGVVHNLGAQVEGEDTSPSVQKAPSPGEWRGDIRPDEPIDKGLDAAQARLDPKNLVLRDVSEEFGRLAIGDGRSRYVSNRFWAALGDEIEEMRDILDPLTSDDEDHPSPDNSGSKSTSSHNHDGFLFGFSSLAHSLRPFHPSRDIIPVLWDTYAKNVAPLIPIFHRPTLKKMVFDAANNLDSLDKVTEATMFCVYYAAVTSMTPSQCFCLLGDDREAVLVRYRFAVEQAMARANFLETLSFTLLQGYTLFLICVRRQDDSRYIWSMTSLVVRIAQGIGIHRDGTIFGLSPYDTEMRRRLWWHICILDFRSTEDHGCDPSTNEALYDTRIPMNINDDDISPETKDMPEERVGCTDMTFSLIRCEVIVAARRLNYILPSPQCPRGTLSLKEREDLISELNARLEERYVKHCDMSIPIFWVCNTLSRLIIAKLWLMAHEPLTRRDGELLAQPMHDRLFLTGIEVIEISRALEVNESTVNWSWLFRTHLQLSVLAFVLSELCVRPSCPVVDRAWNALNSVYKTWEMQSESKKGMLWRAIRKLMARASKFRETQLQELAAQFGNERTNGPVSTGAMTDGNPAMIQPVQQFGSDPNSNMGMRAEQAQHGLLSPPDHPSDIQVGPTMHMFPDNSDAINNYPSLATTSTWLQMGAPSLQGSAGFVPETCNMSAGNQQPSWEDWDQIISEFQMDVAEGAEQHHHAGALVAPLNDWFE